jgi:hypothetical protein
MIDAMFTKRRLKWARPLDRPQFESMVMTAGLAAFTGCTRPRSRLSCSLGY